MYIQFMSSEAVVRRRSIKKVFLEISQNPQENTCVRVLFFNKVTGVSPATLLKKRLWHRRFPVNFVKFLKHHFYRTPLDDCFWTYLYLSLHLLTTEKNQSKRFSRPFQVVCSYYYCYYYRVQKRTLQMTSFLGSLRVF